jgi:hypothetical protein
VANEALNDLAGSAQDLRHAPPPCLTAWRSEPARWLAMT